METISNLPLLSRPKIKKGTYMTYFSTFIVSYLFVGLSSATSEKVIISSSERHVRFLWEGARERILHQSKYLYFITIISGSTPLWAHQLSYFSEVRKRTEEVLKARNSTFSYFHVLVQKTDGEDRFFSLVPEVLEV